MSPNSPDTSPDSQDIVSNSSPDPNSQQTPTQPSPTPANQQIVPQGDNGVTVASPKATNAPTSPTASANGIVANGQTSPSTNPAPATHPAIQRAGILHEIGQALAGGPRYKVSIDQDGNTVRTQQPLTRGQIGMAIALEAISGSLTGLAQSGPGANARGAALAFQQGEQRVTAERQQAEQQASADAAQKSSALVRQANIAHLNVETAAAAQESQSRGLDSILKLVEINRASGVLDAPPESLDNNGVPLTSAEIMSQMQDGKLSSLDHIGPIAGAVAVENKDGSTTYQPTHLIIKDPETKIDLTPEMYARYHAAQVGGFASPQPPTSASVPAPLRLIQGFNESAASHLLANERLQDMRDTVAGTPLASQIPASIDFTKPGVETAMRRFRFYVSHNADNAIDPFMALTAMGQDKRDPKTGEMQANPDAKFVDTVAQQLGGWGLLQKVHDAIATNKKDAENFSIIDSTEKAQAVLAAPKRFTAEHLSSASNFLRIADQQGARKASEEARARAVAEGKDTEAMLRTGINPITHERLSIDNAPDSMLVDSSGRPVPQNQQSLYKPSGQERQTADTARQVIAISNDLQAAINKNPALIGPLAGRSKQAFAKIGIGDAEAQQLLDNVSFLQTASTKMHTGRFSNQILDKMGELIRPGMNPGQFHGALASINSVAQRYALEDKLVTVADYKDMQNATQQQQNALQGAGNHQPTPRVVPPGATPGRNAQGQIIGYRLPNGTQVRF